MKKILCFAMIVGLSLMSVTKVYAIDDADKEANENSEMIISYFDTELDIVKDVDQVKAPKGFVKDKGTLHGKEIPVWTNEKLNKKLVYLKNKDGIESFYLLLKGKAASTFEYQNILGKDMYILEVPSEIREIPGLSFEELEIDNKEIKGWKYEDKMFKNYSIIYVMDMDGENHYYQYEKQENNLQLYSQTAAMSQQTHDLKIKNLKIMIAVLVGIVLVCICYGSYITLKLIKKEKK